MALQVHRHLSSAIPSESTVVQLGPQLPARPAAAQQRVDVSKALYGPQQLQRQAQHSPRRPLNSYGLTGGHGAAGIESNAQDRERAGAATTEFIIIL